MERVVASTSRVASMESAMSEEGDAEEGEEDGRGVGTTKHWWFTPRRLLRLLCAVSVLVYTDRGIMSSAAVSGTPRTASEPNGVGMQGALGANYGAYGALTAAFMIGLLLGCPTFSALATRVNPFRLISYGLGMYAVGECGCALAPSYWFMFACRCLVGVGEASFVSLAAPFIDDYAPPARKTLWLATFYVCVPFGVAFGIFFGGAVAPTMGWRAPFALNAVATIPVALFCFMSPPVRMRGVGERACELSGGSRGAREDGSMFRAFARDCKELFKYEVYVVTIFGYAVYTAVIGVYAVWGPKAGFSIFKDYLRTSTRADMVLGGVTVVSGIAGTLGGGGAVDVFGSSMTNALRTCAAAAFAGFIFLELAFRCTHFHAFVAFLLFGQMFAFFLQAPVNAVVLWSVPPRLRPLACSMTTVTIHLLGDVPTPPLFGHVLERDGPPTPARWRHTCAAFTMLFVVAAAVFERASRRAVDAPDHRRVATAHVDDDDDAEDDERTGGGFVAEEVDDSRDRLLPTR